MKKKTASQIIKEHYNLGSLPNNEEVQAEINNIKRRGKMGVLFDMDQILAARLEAAGYLKPEDYSYRRD